METILLLLFMNILSFGAALMLKMNVNEVYSFIAFNVSIITFVGFINLVSFVRSNMVIVKEENNDSTGTTKDS